MIVIKIQGDKRGELMNQVDTIINKMSTNVVFNVNIGPINIPITDSIISMWIIMAIIIIVALILSHNIKRVPKGKQSLVEMFVELIRGICSDSIDKHAEHFIPFIGTMTLFLVVANMADIPNVIISGLNFVPPTKDMSIVIGLAIISIASVIYAGIRFKKMSGWLKSFIQPLPIILPFKILDYLMKPISLSLRLFGNIAAGYLLMTMIFALVPVMLPGFTSLYFDVFDGILQAYIFVFLTSLYIGEAVEEE